MPRSGAARPLVKAPNWLSHLEYEWKSPLWRHWLEGISRDHTYIRYDARGCGLSDRDPAEVSLEAWVRDLEAVVDAAKLERFPLLGLSQGAAIAIALRAAPSGAREPPRPVRRLRARPAHARRAGSKPSTRRSSCAS